MTDFVQELNTTAKAIADRIADLPKSSTRCLAAIAGPPGSGKSTLAEAVVLQLLAGGHDAVLMPMDGFHLDNRLLGPRGLLSRKGAPETFDFGGFATAVRRVRDEPSVIIPVFDRSREIAIAGAAEIQPATRIVVVEGNYLLLNEDPWCELAKMWDFSVFLDVPMDILEQRLVDRWLGHGYAPDAALAKARENDIANARRVVGAVCPADLHISTGAKTGA